MLALACFFAGAAGSAWATPYVDIRAYWFVTPGSGTTIPSGVTLSCFGGATGLANGCTDSRSIDASVTGPEQLSADAMSGLTVTNTTDQSFAPTQPFRVEFSAFNPGGPMVGISIDDPPTEAASFASTVSGPQASDFHSCSVGFLGDSGHLFSPTTCGVDSPDSSEGMIYIDVPPGQSEQLAYSIDMTADFAVPEASSASILAIALLGFGEINRRKRNRRWLLAAQPQFFAGCAPADPGVLDVIGEFRC
ncbi:MAG TPA: hypothetical protein VGM07_12020 [Stellaceae bacterium]